MKNKLLIYYKALEIAERGDTIHIGLCHFLTDAICQIEHNLFLYHEDRDREYTEEENDAISVIWYSVRGAARGDNNMFPEILKYKPENVGSYWFPSEDRQIRIDILKEIIQSLQNEKKAIYLCAIDFLKEGSTIGFCMALTKAILKIKHNSLDHSRDWELFDSVWNFVIENIKGEGKEFLELVAYRPEDYQDTLYWWGDHSSLRRIEILNTIISGMEE